MGGEGSLEEIEDYRFFALQNKISLCISPKKNDDDMKE